MLAQALLLRSQGVRAGHYLVVETRTESEHYVIHNVYGPQLHKADLFARLAAMQFPDDSRHLVLGDLNAVLDPSIDSATGEVRDGGARQQALRWLAQLGVVDPWRVHHPSEKLFSNPLPRRNRLDYILVDGPTVTHHYSGAEYFAHHHGG
ncbi:hypothetical protein PybrP1_006467 [[Pythium] brassicae (nom. inval.)]|nr:hypothetical protein PybrP1_006467 [[Pythium] brassicae (nom. inval.)]